MGIRFRPLILLVALSLLRLWLILIVSKFEVRIVLFVI